MADEEEKLHITELIEVKENIPTKTPQTHEISLTTAAVFLTGVTFASMMGGFGVSLGMARKKSPDAFVTRYNDGVKLAARALGYGSLLAVSGVGLIVYGVKKALGVSNVSIGKANEMHPMHGHIHCHHHHRLVVVYFTCK